MKSIDQRLTEIEVILSHQQKLIADLNEVTIDMQKRLDLMPREMARLNEAIRLTRELTHEVRRPEEEKPPHY